MAKFIGQISKVQNFGMGVPSGMGWQCQISGFIFSMIFGFCCKAYELLRMGIVFELF